MNNFVWYALIVLSANSIGFTSEEEAPNQWQYSSESNGVRDVPFTKLSLSDKKPSDVQVKLSVDASSSFRFGLRILIPLGVPF